MLYSNHKQWGLTIAMVFGILACAVLVMNPDRSTSQTYIVQGQDLNTIKVAVQAVGGEITHELSIINSVGAELTPAERRALEQLDYSLRVYSNGSVRTAGGSVLQAFFPSIVDADRLHSEGITGAGVTVAILDTGVWPNNPIKKDTSGNERILAGYNTFTGAVDVAKARDKNGHGIHLASSVLNSELGSSGKYNGIAPDASLVVVQSFDDSGHSSYLNVIDGINWIIANN